MFEQKYKYSRWSKLKLVKTNFECLSILDDLGYIPAVANSDQTISDIIGKCLNQIGKSYSKAILYNMCLLYGLSEHELLTNYDLFEKSLNRVLGKSGNAIVSRIKKEMLTYAVISRSDITVQDILNPSLKIDDIVKYIREVEIFNFVNKIPYDHHAILLYSRENNKNKHVIRTRSARTCHLLVIFRIDFLVSFTKLHCYRILRRISIFLRLWSLFFLFRCH